MTESSTEKKKIFYMIVLILTLITMIIGATLAYFKFVASQKEEGTVLYTGTLQISYLDGTYIKNPELLPLSNVTYDTYDKVYRNTFAVASSGTLDQTISIDLEVSTNEFTENALKYAIFNSQGIEMSRGYVPKSGNVNLTSNLFLAHGETSRYTLIIWWDNTDYEQQYEAGHIISGKINVYAKQIKY